MIQQPDEKLIKKYSQELMKIYKTAISSTIKKTKSKNKSNSKFKKHNIITKAQQSYNKKPSPTNTQTKILKTNQKNNTNSKLNLNNTNSKLNLNNTNSNLNLNNTNSNLNLNEKLNKPIQNQNSK